jgi:hypothetical protein
MKPMGTTTLSVGAWIALIVILAAAIAIGIYLSR